MPIRHSFVSGFADGGDATLLRPSDWNADHEGSAGFDPADAVLVVDDCFSIFPTIADQVFAGAVTAVVVGTGASAGNVQPDTSEANHPGIVQLYTGTSSSGQASMVASVAGLNTTKGAIRFGAAFKLSALSNGTNRYLARAGIGHTIDSIDTRSGVFFRYSDNVNSGKWQAVCNVSDGTETTADTGITADTGWHTWEFQINALATSAEFFIDGASVATISTNLPTANDILALCPATIVKSAGTTGRSLFLDAYWLLVQPDPARTTIGPLI